MRMSEQFEEILMPRLEKLDGVAKAMGDLLIDRMEANTAAGISFPNEEYEKDYSASHARKRRKKGYQTGHVDLRMGQRRIETARSEIQVSGKPGVHKAEIGFDKGGIIFNYHHRGSGNNPSRVLFPTSKDNVPDALKDEMRSKLTDLLRGQ